MPDVRGDLFGHEHLDRPVFGGDMIRLAPRAQRELWDRAELVWRWGKPGLRGGGGPRLELHVGRCAAGLWWGSHSYDLFGSQWGEFGGGSPFCHPHRDRAAAVAQTASSLLAAVSGRHRLGAKARRALDTEWRPSLAALGAALDA